MDLSLKGICYTGDKPHARLQDDFETVDRLLEEKYPGVRAAHNFLVGNGLRDALVGNKPTRRRGARQILHPTVGMFAALAAGERPLIKSFGAVTISAGKVYGNPESLLLLGGWDDAWTAKKDLEASIGYKISDLEMATVDASELVKVAGSRPWEARTVPKRRTTKDEHGEPVLKKRRDEGKKPATCYGCGKKFFSSSTKFMNGGCIKCLGCGAFKAKYD